MTRTGWPPLALAAVLAAVLMLELLGGPDPDSEPPAAPAAVDAASPGAASPAMDGAGKDDGDAGLDGLVRTVLARPLFSPGRRPAPPTDAAAGGASDSLPRLAGVIVGPGGGRAIFAPAEGHTLVVPEGGHVGRYVVRAIAPGQVTLSDAEKQLVIRPSHAKGTPP